MPGEPHILVIGAGVAGLAAARELSHRGARVVVLERARGVGGRCASKTIHGRRVDYGVPYLHGSHPHFLGAVEQSGMTGLPVRILSGWPHRVVNPRLACQPSAFAPGHRRLAIAEGVSAFPKSLATQLQIVTETPITLLHPVKDGIEAESADGRRFRAPSVILALAPPQAVRLLEPIATRIDGGEELLASLSAISYFPALTVVAGYNHVSPEPSFEALFPIDTTILQAIFNDATKRDRAARPTLVLQARPRYSLASLELEEPEWFGDLVWEAAELLGNWARRPAWIWGHRWRWARMAPGHVAPVIRSHLAVDGGGTLGLCGECFSSTGGVEGAFLSGVTLARAWPAPEAPRTAVC